MIRAFLLILVFTCCENKTMSQEHHQTVPLVQRIDKTSILGIWWSPEMEQTAAFQIEDSTIYYPDQFAQYPYDLRHDTILVFREEGVLVSLVVRITPDTLVLSTYGHEAIYTRSEPSQE